MPKNIHEFVSNAPVRRVAVKVALPDDENEDALSVGGEPQSTEPSVLSPDDSRHLREFVRSKEPIVLMERMREAVTNYKRIMG